MTKKTKGFRLVHFCFVDLPGRKIRTSDDGTSGEVLTLFDDGFGSVELDSVRVRQ